MKLSKRTRTLLRLLTPIAAVVLLRPVEAGTPQVEADRCQRWLDGFVQGRLDQVADIATEVLRSGDVPEPYVKAQRENLAKLFDKLSAIGSGPPKLAGQADDFTVEETGDTIKRRIWRFPTASIYVGCVSYPGTDRPKSIFRRGSRLLTLYLCSGRAKSTSRP